MEEDKKEEIEIVKVTEELIKVKNNSERFASDFAFKLTKVEVNNLRSKNLTSSWSGSRYLPNAFTEQCIYMLMTILKGDLAVKQSIDLVRTFKKMKDYILENLMFRRLFVHDNRMFAERAFYCIQKNFCGYNKHDI